MSGRIIDEMTPEAMQLELGCVGGHDLERHRYTYESTGVAVAVGCPTCATSFGMYVTKEPTTEADDE